jgi:DNA-binding LacI/PurR family transcriptional regulator
VIDSAFFEEIKEKLDKESPVPLYYQLAALLEKDIKDNKLKDKDILPGNTEMAKILGINFRTVHKAYGSLEDMGLIERKRRLGSIVLSPEKVLNKNIGFYYFSENIIHMICVADSLQKKLSPLGYDLKLIPFEEGFYDDVDLLKDAQKRQLAGAVIVPLNNGPCLEKLKLLEKAKFPHVRFGNKFFSENLDYPLITGNEASAMRDAIEYLENNGHQNIGFISSGVDKGANEVYESMIADKACFQKRWYMDFEFSISFDSWRKAHGAQIVRGYLAENPDITALVVENPIACLEVYRQAINLDIKIPKNLSLIGFEFGSVFDELSSYITASHLSFEKMTLATVDALMKMIKLQPCDKLYTICYDLIEQETVAINEEAS